MSIRYQADPADLAKAQKLLEGIPGAIALAERDALNKTMQHARTVAATDLAKEMTARKGDVMRRIGMAKATKDNRSAAIYISGQRGVNLIGFYARQTTKSMGRKRGQSGGVRAKIFGTWTLVDHAFITRGTGDSGAGEEANGSRFVAMRTGVKQEAERGRYSGRTFLRGPRKGQPILREKLATVRGPTVAETFANTPGIAIHTQAEILNDLPKNLENQVSRRLKEAEDA